MRDMNGFQKKKNQNSLGKWLIWRLEQEMRKDTLRITCAEKEERYQTNNLTIYLRNKKKKEN